MTYLTNTTASLLASNAATSTPAKTGPSFWQRLYAAMIESRRRSAMRELRARSFFVSEAEIVLGGYPQTTLTNDTSLPFNR